METRGNLKKLPSSLELAASLKRAMLKKELTLTLLAKQTQMNKSTLHGWLNGILPRSLIELSKVAHTLDISLDELCYGKKPFQTTLITDEPVVLRISVEKFTEK